jgi:putative copper export protein
MAFAELDGATILLRAMTYAGTIAVAGSTLFAMTMGWTAQRQFIRSQVLAGAFVLLICEPIRYGLFQLSIAQGDVALAFDPSMRWIGMETPIGQASLTRLAGLCIALVGLLSSSLLAAAGALIMIGSFLIEGHTASSDLRYLLMPLLFLHLLVAHWWFGALLPLRIALGTRVIADSQLSGDIHLFGQQAIVAVAILFGAGALLLSILIDWQPDLTKAYQQGFLLKIGAFFIIMLIAAINKLRLTPLLRANPIAGRLALRRSISIEISVAAAILIATATATSFPPVDH